MNRQTDRQTDRDNQTDRQTDRDNQTDRQTDHQTDRQTDRQMADSHTLSTLFPSSSIAFAFAPFWEGCLVGGCDEGWCEGGKVGG